MKPLSRGIVMKSPTAERVGSTPPPSEVAAEYYVVPSELILRFEGATALENPTNPSRIYYAVAWLDDGLNMSEVRSSAAPGPSPRWYRYGLPDHRLDLPFGVPLKSLHLHVEILRSSTKMMTLQEDDNSSDDDPQCSNREVVVGRARINLTKKWWRTAFNLNLRLERPPWRSNSELSGMVQIKVCLRPQQKRRYAWSSSY